MSFFIQACKQKDTREKFYNDQGLLVKRWFYPDKTIKIEATYKGDTVAHGYWKSFHPSGKLKAVAEVANGKKNGKETDYYPNGTIQLIGFFKDDKKDSVWLWYDSLGRLVSKIGYVKGVRCGNVYHYFPSGKIKMCYFYNPAGEAASKIEYDSMGIEKSRQGDFSPIVVFVTTHKNDQWKVGEEFKARVYINECSTKGEVEIQFKEAKSVKIMSSEKFSATDGVMHYSKTLDKAGDYFFNVIQDDSHGLVNKTEIRVEK